MEWKRGLRYAPGTLLQRRNGYVFIKTAGGMVAHHRWAAANLMLHRELRDGEKVFRREPNREDNRPGNLVVIRHNLERFKYLPRPRILYVPARRKERAAVAA